MTLDQICAQILNRPPTPHRRLVAVVGPPASGKSTFAENLATHLSDGGEVTTVVPMDGFHLDNRLLKRDGTEARKGAPHTFDAYGFVRTLAALQSRDPVVFPLFDRSQDIAIAGAGRVEAICRTVIVEGNYLLLNQAPWDALHAMWNFSIALRPPFEVMQDRLRARWRDHSKPNAQAWIEMNDIPNINTVLTQSASADITMSEVPT